MNSMSRQAYEALLVAVHGATGAVTNYWTPGENRAIIRLGEVAREARMPVDMAGLEFGETNLREALADCGWTERDGRRALWHLHEVLTVDQVLARVRARWNHEDRAEVAATLADPTLADWERELIDRHV